MPQYTLEDSATKRRLVVEGDHEPSESEIEGLFKQAESDPAIREEWVKEETWRESSASDKLASDISRGGRAFGESVGGGLKGVGTVATGAGATPMLMTGGMAPAPGAFENYQRVAAQQPDTVGGRLAQVGQNPIYQAGQRITEQAQKNYPSVQPGSVTRPLGAVSEAVGNVGGSLVAGPAALQAGTVMELNDAYEAELARQQKANEQPDAEKAFIKATAYAGSTVPIEMGLGVGRILRKIKKYFGAGVAAEAGREAITGGKQAAYDFVKERLKDSGAGFAQEFSEAVTQDLIVEGHADLAKDFQEGVLGTIGQATVGGVAQGTAMAGQAAGRAMQRPGGQAQAQPQAPKQPQQQPAVELPPATDTDKQPATDQPQGTVTLPPLQEAPKEAAKPEPVKQPVEVTNELLADIKAALVNNQVQEKPVGRAPESSQNGNAVQPEVPKTGTQPTAEAPAPVEAPTAQAVLDTAMEQKPQVSIDTEKPVATPTPAESPADRAAAQGVNLDDLNAELDAEMAKIGQNEEQPAQAPAIETAVLDKAVEEQKAQPQRTPLPDFVEIQRVKDSIREGELRLQHGKDASGKKFTEGQRKSIQRAIEYSTNKLAALEGREQAAPVSPASDAPKPGQSVQSDETGATQTVSPQPEVGKRPKVGRGLRARKIFDHETEFGNQDVMAWLVDEYGGMLSRSAAKRIWGKEKFEQNKSQWDDAPVLQKPHHNLIYSANEHASSPDQVAQAAYAAAQIDEPSTNSLWAAIDHASKTRARGFEDQRLQNVALQHEENAHMEWRRATAAGGMEIAADDLMVGSILDVEGQKLKVVEVDPDTGDVVLEDGSKFGIQRLASGEHIWVEMVQHPNAETGFLPPEAPAQLPTLKQMQNQGDLLVNQTEDFALTGEKGTDYERIQRAKEQAARDKAESENGQSDMFGSDALREEPENATYGSGHAEQQSFENLQGREQAGDNAGRQPTGNRKPRRGSPVATSKASAIQSATATAEPEPIPEDSREQIALKLEQRANLHESWIDRLQKVDLPQDSDKTPALGQITYNQAYADEARQLAWALRQPNYVDLINQRVTRLERLLKELPMINWVNDPPPEEHNRNRAADGYSDALDAFYQYKADAEEEANKDQLDLKLSEWIEKTNFKPGAVHEGVTGAPIWMTRALLNGALRVARASYRAGKALAEAVSDAVDWLRRQNIEGFDDTEAADYLTGELRQRSEEAGGIQPGAPSPEGTRTVEQAIKDTFEELPERLKSVWRSAQDTGRSLGAMWHARFLRDTLSWKKDAADNIANIFGRRASNAIRHELNRAFGASTYDEINARNMVRESALTMVIEAGVGTEQGGSVDNLAEFRERILTSEFSRSPWAKNALRAIDYAVRYWDTLVPVAEQYAKVTDLQNITENEAGIRTLYRSGGYVFHTQDVEESNIFPSPTGGTAGAPAPFRHVRDYDTYAASIAAGLKPKSLSAIDLLQRRLTLGRKLINYGKWLDSLKGMVDPTTDMPLATECDVRLRRDGTQDVTAPPGYARMHYAGRDLAVHKGYTGIFKALTKDSWMRDSVVRESLMKLAATSKHATLLFDTFHLGRLMFWNGMASAGVPRYKRGLILLDMTPADIEQAVAEGSIPQEYAQQMRDDKALLDQAIRHGLNVGNVADNLYTDWVQKMPGIGHFNKWLFEQYQRGAMSNVFLIEYQRQRKSDTKSTDAEVIRRVARDVNIRFGNLNSQSWIKSRTGQDLARLVFLAPQWNESLIRAEGGAVAQAAMTPVRLAQGRGVMPGMLARTVGTAILGTFILNQMLNYAFKGKPTWDNDDDDEGWDKKISAWLPDVVGGGPGFYLNPLSIPAEITHLLSKGMERNGGDFMRAVEQFLVGRLNTIGRPIYTFFTGKDTLGHRAKSGWDKAGMMVKQALPLPISGSAIYRAGKQMVSGQNEEAFTGQYQKQVMQSFGMKTDQAPNAEQRIRRLATEYNSKDPVAQRMQTQGEFAESPYRPLAEALRRGNMRDADDAMTELLTKRDPKQIREYFHDYPKRKFTGNAARERKFWKELTPNQKTAYRDAVKARQDLAKQAYQLLRERTATETAQ